MSVRTFTGSTTQTRDARRGLTSTMLTSRSLSGYITVDLRGQPSAIPGTALDPDSIGNLYYCLGYLPDLYSTPGGIRSRLTNHMKELYRPEDVPRFRNFVTDRPDHAVVVHADGDPAAVGHAGPAARALRLLRRSWPMRCARRLGARVVARHAAAATWAVIASPPLPPPYLVVPKADISLLLFIAAMAWSSFTSVLHHQGAEMKGY